MGDQTRIIKDQSNLGQFSSAIAQICEEKGIDKDSVIKSIEAALAAAYKKDYGKKGQIIIAKIDEQTSETNFKQLKEVVDESTRTIDEEYLSEESHQIPENALKSKEKIERHQPVQAKSEELSKEEVTLPRFNPERDVLLEDAKKIIKNIELGDYIEFPLETKDQYGRIASQTAKQVIIQKIREAERESMYEEFKGKEGEIVNGTVQRVENGKVFVDLGKSTGILFPSEQIPGEEYRIGQRLKLYIDKVDHDSRSLGINLSRRHPQLLGKLFELEVPEIFSGTIEIKSIAREAGSRSKIAVVSNDEDIDPIGSCVGQKGTRVQAVIDELNGEKIDIIDWNDNAEVMIAQALSPAKILKVELLDNKESVDVKESNNNKEADKKEKENDEDENAKDRDKKEEKEESFKDDIQKKAIAYVTEDQLSLAIGKRGQNVRLAAKLTGWNINVEAIKLEDDSKNDDDGVGSKEELEEEDHISKTELANKEEDGKILDDKKAKDSQGEDTQENDDKKKAKKEKDKEAKKEKKEKKDDKKEESKEVA